MPQKRTNEAKAGNLSPAAKKWHEQVTSYLERRMDVAEAREDDIEVSYLETCLMALTLCEHLGISLEPPADKD